MKPSFTIKIFTLFFIATSFAINCTAQLTIGNFTSLNPTGATQTQLLQIPTSHTFQRIIRTGDALSLGGNMGANNDFTCYVPTAASSTNGKLSISSESTVGEVAILDISFNNTTHLWQVGAGGKVTFNPTDMGSVTNFCSGTLTPNNTVIVGEEVTNTLDANTDGYHDRGWLIEIDPATRTVVNQTGGNPTDKLWAIGKFQHENAVIKSDNTVLYAGADDGVNGFLYKFVPTVPGDFSSGSLYVLRTTGAFGNGTWKLIPNTTQANRNGVVTSAAAAPAAYNFNRIEDVDIGPDGKIYFAATTDSRIYRFTDNGTFGTATDISGLEVFAGNSTAGVTYDVDGPGGAAAVAWGTGNDNLCFDGEGNLWVLQDGGSNFIWVIGPTHTQASPQVRLFGKTPTGSEATGMTFTPDYKFMFLSIQHPSTLNTTEQSDATGATGASTRWNTHTTIVIGRTSALGPLATLPVTFTNFTAQKSGTGVAINWSVSEASGHAYFSIERSTDGVNYSEIHRNNEDINGQGSRSFTYNDGALPSSKVLYYRIKQCDLNDECKYTEIKTLQFDEKKDFIVYPVPAQDVVNVTFTSRALGAIRITIADESGRRVLTESKTVVAGRNNLSLNIAGLRNGQYIISADNGQEKWTSKLVKQ